MHGNRLTPRAAGAVERCAICRCILHRTRGTYATTSGRAHASKHHFVAERFFGRSGNRKGTERPRIFQTCPWGYERKTAVFCYECHELLLHNPVMLPDDIAKFSELVHRRGLTEADAKSASFKKIGKRIILLREVISLGLQILLEASN